VLLAATLVVGCSFAAPPIRYFEVRAPQATAGEGAMLPSVVVPNFSCLAAYDHLRVVMRRSPVEVVTSRTLQWTTVPGRMIAQGVRVQLEGTKRFETVRRDAKPLPPYSVEGQVQVIELNEHPSMSARLALHINVRRTTDGAVIEELFIDETAPAGGNDAADGVLALRDLFGRILEDLAARVVKAIEDDARA
jgi:ABC-type uncharacterized transport system auxiliary subunit